MLRRTLTTAPLVVLGLAGGFATAEITGVRALGGAVLAVAGLLAGVAWLRRLGVGPAVGLGSVYLGSFAASHPLAGLIGPWPAVWVATILAAGVTVVVEVTDHRRRSPA